jgi:hypothetical protein
MAAKKKKAKKSNNRQQGDRHYCRPRICANNATPSLLPGAMKWLLPAGQKIWLFGI